MTATTDPLAQLHKAVTVRQPGWPDTLTAGSWWAGGGDATCQVARRFELDGYPNVEYDFYQAGRFVGRGSADGAAFTAQHEPLDHVAERRPT